MTRVEREKLHALILNIVINADQDDLYYDTLWWGGEYCEATARRLSKLVYRRLRYWVRVEEIKHALKSISVGDGYYHIDFKD